MKERLERLSALLPWGLVGNLLFGTSMLCFAAGLREEAHQFALWAILAVLLGQEEEA